MKFDIYQDKKGEWRWRLRAANHRIVADSGEGYKNRGDCIDIIKVLKRDIPSASVEDITKEPPLVIT